MLNYDTANHVTGASRFLDDIPVQEGTLQAGIFASQIAHGKIKSVDYSECVSSKGIFRVITFSDVTGQNQIGGIIQDEPLLAENEVHFMGQPIAIVLGTDIFAIKQAIKKIKIEITPLPVVIDPREAYAKGDLIIPPRIFSSGDLEQAFNNADHIYEGKCETPGQEHLYLETQSAYAYVTEADHLKVYSSTQGPTAVQRCVSRVTGLPMNKIEIDTPRIGGGFGGKEDQANAWGAVAALAAWVTKKPVKLILPREDDMYMTGKRHPYSIDYKIGLSKDLKITAFEVTFYQNAGASADLSTPILDRTLFHANNSYFIPNVKATGLCCRTNLPPNTAYRGFGGPQGMFAIESAIHQAATDLGVDPLTIQNINLLSEGDIFHYGQAAKNCNARVCFDKVLNDFDVDSMSEEVKNFNAQNKLVKKGLAVMPICFGISFTNTFMNQASALVHVYSDSSISISTGAVEMGQGVNMKMRQVAATIFGVDISTVRVESTNTTRTANTSPTAASSGADMNGKALELACNDIKARLLKFAESLIPGYKAHDKLELSDSFLTHNGVNTDISFTELVSKGFFNRVNLSAHANYAVPNIFFDKVTNKGDAFAYYSFGSAVVSVTLDCLLGTYEIEEVKMVHDFGNSFSKKVDKGQAEGAVVQGIGWLTSEDIIFDENGKLLTNSLSTYKVPDIYSAPKNIEVQFLENSNSPSGVFNAKAIGEPPFMYGIGAFFALTNAMKSFRPHKKIDYTAPLSPERVLMWLHS